MPPTAEKAPRNNSDAEHSTDDPGVASKKQRLVKKVIIDTDPGVDDAMAILCAFNAPEIEVVGLTTIYGNVPTTLATANALRLCELAGKQVPVAQGSLVSMKGVEKLRIADFVHGQDGFGNVYLPPPKGREADHSAAEFIVQMVHQNPGEISILALAPLTNIAQALRLDPELGHKWKELIVLGGAFFCNGNVNPAAEANIFGDPEAADFVFGHSEKIKVLGLDVTQRVPMTAKQLNDLEGRGKHGSLVCKIAQFYLDYHREAYNMEAIYLHDPTAFVALLEPDELFTWRRGAVRVVEDGVAKGHTIMDAGVKVWRGGNDWMDRPKIQVACDVEAERVVQLIIDLLSL